MSKVDTSRIKKKLSNVLYLQLTELTVRTTVKITAQSIEKERV